MSIRDQAEADDTTNDISNILQEVTDRIYTGDTQELLEARNLIETMHEYLRELDKFFETRVHELKTLRR